MQIELPEKRYYGIGEVARAFDVNTSLIRFWEKEFDALKPKKNAKGKEQQLLLSQISKNYFYIVRKRQKSNRAIAILFLYLFFSSLS